MLRRALFFLTATLSGRSAWAEYARMGQLERMDGPAYRAVLLNKLNHLLQHHLAKPFYGGWARDQGAPTAPLADLTELARFPIITKDVLTDHFDDFAAGAEGHLDSTSGSTGRNFRFLHTRAVRKQMSAATRYVHDLIGVDYYNDRKTTVWGKPHGSWVRQLVHTWQCLMINERFVFAYGMDKPKAIAALESIRRWRPVQLCGYPGMLERFADLAEEAGASCPANFRAIVTSGEQCFPHQQERLEAFYGAPVYQRYGSREFGPIAHHCIHRNGLHVPPGRLVVETGPEGELLVTDLDNLSTPFVRYAIGDLGRVEWADCGCGRHLQSIHDLHGRSNDYLSTPGGKVLPSQFWTTLSREAPGIKEYQVIQETPTAIRVLVVPTADFGDHNRAVMARAIQEVIGHEAMELTIETVARIEPSPSGKRRFIINRVAEARQRGKADDTDAGDTDAGETDAGETGAGETT